MDGPDGDVVGASGVDLPGRVGGEPDREPEAPRCLDGDVVLPDVDEVGLREGTSCAAVTRRADASASRSWASDKVRSRTCTTSTPPRIAASR